MKTIKTYINSTSQDAYTKFGVELAETSVTALMTPPPLKDYITNKSALSHGKQVLTANGNVPKTDERDVQLTISLEAPTLAKFLMRYRAFCTELKKGAITLTLYISEGSTYYKETFYLKYLSCSQYSEFNGRLGKFVMKFCEPNPETRELEYSNDITL